MNTNAQSNLSKNAKNGIAENKSSDKLVCRVSVSAETFKIIFV